MHKYKYIYIAYIHMNYIHIYISPFKIGNIYIFIQNLEQGKT